MKTILFCLTILLLPLSALAETTTDTQPAADTMTNQLKEEAVSNAEGMAKSTANSQIDKLAGDSAAGQAVAGTAKSASGEAVGTGGDEARAQLGLKGSADTSRNKDEVQVDVPGSDPYNDSDL